MSRFYSNHEMAKMDKNLNEDELLDTQKYKNDLKKALNDEYHRVNVDSAKKKAVNQRMNYDGFHQMVLGADLKGIKQNEISNIVSNKNSVMNSSLVTKRLGEEVDVISKNFINVENAKNEIMQLNPEKVDYSIFVKQWKSCKTMDKKIEYFLLQNFANIISGVSFLDADFFGDFLQQCGMYLKDKSENGSSIITGLFLITEHKSFPGLKKFISKKVKNLYNEIDENRYDESFGKLKNLLNS
jgi:hypothetical protein